MSIVTQNVLKFIAMLLEVLQMANAMSLSRVEQLRYTKQEVAQMSKAEQIEKLGEELFFIMRTHKKCNVVNYGMNQIMIQYRGVVKCSKKEIAEKAIEEAKDYCQCFINGANLYTR